jgi:hypothetical protein
VGLPWQISGSATMYSPNSTRSVACLPFFIVLNHTRFP